MRRSVTLFLLLLSACGEPTESPEPTPPAAAAPVEPVDTEPPTFAEGATLSAEAGGRPDETPRRVTLRWEVVPEDDDELVGYVVRVDDEVALQLDAPAQEAVLEDVSFATPRRFTLAAVDGAGNESEPLETRDALAPRWPTGEGVTTEREGDAYVLRWGEAVDDGTVSGYVIERDGEELASLPPSARTFPLPAGEDASIRLVVRDDAGHTTSVPVPSLRRAEAQAAQMAQLETVLLGALGSEGALEDVLASGAVIGNAEDVMARAEGVGVAQRGGGSLRSRGGGGTATSLGGLGGSGSSLGGLRTRSTPRPQGRVSIGQPIRAEGSAAFDASTVFRSLRARTRLLQTCHARELRDAPEISGPVRAELTIAPSGAISSARVTDNATGSSALGDCVARALHRLRFNPGPEGGPATFRVRFVFLPPAE